MDRFKGNKCLVAFILPTLTCELQPNDQLVNHFLKSKLTVAFDDFYTEKFIAALDLDEHVIKIKIDTWMVAKRDAHVKCVVKAFTDLSASHSIIFKSWGQAGLAAPMGPAAEVEVGGAANGTGSDNETAA